MSDLAIQCECGRIVLLGPSDTAVAFEDTFLASEEADNADSAHRVTCAVCRGPGPQCDAGLLLERAAIEAGKAHRAATAATRAAYAARRGT